MTQTRQNSILLLGARGLLGEAFAASLSDRTLVTAGRDRLEGASESTLATLLDESEPTLVINCAADVDAEGAETDDSIAVAANVTLPQHLARLCAARGASIIQFSSTGCYGDWKDTPYHESDPLCPTTRHHRTKALGEDAIRASGASHLIVRTGWLYGGAAWRPRNFVWQRLVEASQTESLVADGHQRGSPTWVRDLALQTLHAWDSGARGTVNAVAKGVATRADYVAAIVKAAGLPCKVVAGPAFRRRAPVSANEAAVNTRLKGLDLDTMPDWRDSIRRYVEELKDTSDWTRLLRSR